MFRQSMYEVKETMRLCMRTWGKDSPMDGNQEEKNLRIELQEMSKFRGEWKMAKKDREMLETQSKESCVKVIQGLNYVGERRNKPYYGTQQVL